MEVAAGPRITGGGHFLNLGGYNSPARASPFFLPTARLEGVFNFPVRLPLAA
jgi:hypothetical protein